MTHPTIQPNAWAPANATALNAALWRWAQTPSPTPRVAAFDFDNTCMFNDLGELFLREQLQTLTFGISPDDLAVTFPSTTQPHIHAAQAAIQRHYGALWPRIQARDVGVIPSDDAFSFATLVAWYYDQLLSAPCVGPCRAYAWSAKLLGGLSIQETSDLLARTIDAHRDAPIQVSAWTSHHPELDQRLMSSFMQGLRPIPEVIDLMHALQAAGVEVCIVSASPQPLVQEAAALLGYPVRKENIFGMRPDVIDGRYSPRLVDPSVQPWTCSDGKLALLRACVVGEVVLTAGDSVTDYALLVGSPSVEVVLLFDRDRPEASMQALYAEALRPEGEGRRRVLLQGMDENTGGLVPRHASTLLGACAPRELRALDGMPTGAP
jgi:phosphoserine phosphatase